MSSELQIIDIREGYGKAVVKGALITTQYTGWLADGSEFDSSRTRVSRSSALLAPAASSKAGTRA